MALGWRSQYSRYKDFFLNVIGQYKRRRDILMFLEIILSAATVTFFAIFAIRPTVMTISELYKEIKRKEEINKTMDEKILNLAKAQEIYNNEIDRISLLNIAVPVNPQPEVFVRQIESLSGKNSLSMTNISLGQVILFGAETVKTKTSSVFKELPEKANGMAFSVTVSGSYPSIFSFISDLENLRRVVKVDTAGLNNQQTKEEKTINLVISGRTPYLGEKSSANKNTNTSPTK
jgi:Tfp pilus assembly protein PilO